MTGGLLTLEDLLARFPSFDALLMHVLALACEE